MASERELKFRVLDRPALIARLIDVEAEQIASTQFEDNWVFDKEGELLEKKCLLRLRVDGHGSTLTYKGPATFEGAVKVRSEHETGIEDSEAAQGILEQLGYRVVTRYQKRREEWRLGGITVALDDTPIGHYVEFEGEGAERLARRCGFSDEGAEPRTYLELYADYRQQNPEAPEEMVFP